MERAAEPLVVWINGAFGVGKTSVAEELVRLLPGSALFDPETLGALLRGVIPPGELTDDFQDIPSWRQLTREAVVSLALAQSPGGAVVVPMTIWRDDYFTDVVGGLRNAGVEVVHVTLVAPASLIAARLRSRSDGEDWGLERVERCVAALSAPQFAVHVDVGSRAPGAIAEELAAIVHSFAVPERV